MRDENRQRSSLANNFAEVLSFSRKSIQRFAVRRRRKTDPGVDDATLRGLDSVPREFSRVNQLAPTEHIQLGAVPLGFIARTPPDMVAFDVILVHGGAPGGPAPPTSIFSCIEIKTKLS